MNHNDILGVTMAGLEAGFKVSHIAAFDLEVCGPDMSVGSVLNDSKLMDFDHIPVIEGSRIVGMLERGSLNHAGTVRDGMRRLDGEMLVSAEQPLPKFLPTLAESPYRLVVQGTKIEGIVTLSDVAKLPVRLLAFTSVAHLEAVLTEVIRRKYSHDDEAWLLLLDKYQRNEVAGRLKGRKKQNIHLLSSIEVAGFRHKLTAVANLRKLTKLESDRESIVTFRNSLAHDGDFVKECKGIEGLLERLGLVRHWIDALKYDESGKDPTNA
jgi:CBS domain-containing protein